MCVASIALGAHPRWPLVVAANRDEYHARPAAPLARWDNGLLAGRDLRSGGTWLGVHPALARLVLVTNFRVPGYPLPDRPSRGGLVAGLLAGDDPLAVPIAAFNPFNLAVVIAGEGRFLTNHPAERRQPLAPGIHGLSNGDFAHPWPKARALDAALSAWLAGPAADPQDLLVPLSDDRAFPPEEAPGPGPEPRFSGVFIRDPLYGTRCSSVIAIAADGKGRFLERSYDAAGATTGTVTLDFAWGT